MTAGELSRRIGGTLIAANADHEISRGMVCDMLSHAMAHGKAGCAWITVQTHMTAVAIATQCSMACIIWPDGIAADMLSAQRAEREGIAIICSPLSAYEIAGIMHKAGIQA